MAPPSTTISRCPINRSISPLTLLSNSFGTGIAGGLLSYVLVKLLSGKGRDVSPGMFGLAVPLAYYFWTVVSKH